MQKYSCYLAQRKHLILPTIAILPRPFSAAIAISGFQPPQQFSEASVGSFLTTLDLFYLTSVTKKNGNGYFVECGKLSGVICRKFDADFFGGMKGKVRNETMQNVAKMNIY